MTTNDGSSSGTSGGTSSSGAPIPATQSARLKKQRESTPPTYLSVMEDEDSGSSAPIPATPSASLERERGVEIPGTTRPLFSTEKSASGFTTGGGGGSPASSSVPTTVNQKPAEGGAAPTGSTDPRTDTSVVLAGRTMLKEDKSPYSSNNFVSLVGKAGGLGRRTDASKRTLIGGV